MTQFVTKGDAPLTPVQLEKRAQKHIKRVWPDQAREKSIRLADGAFDAFMSTFSTNHDVNIANNTFNWQLQEYRKATARLAQYVLADGRAEVTEMQPTGEQVFNEETMEMEELCTRLLCRQPLSHWSLQSHAWSTLMTWTQSLQRKPLRTH